MPVSPVMIAYVAGRVSGPHDCELEEVAVELSTFPARSVARAWKVKVPAGKDRYSCTQPIVKKLEGLYLHLRHFKHCQLQQLDFEIFQLF